MNEKELEFKKNLDHLIELMKDPKVGFKTFIGYGMMPVCNSEYYVEICETLSKCLKDEEFLEFIQSQIFGDDI